MATIPNITTFTTSRIIPNSPITHKLPSYCLNNPTWNKPTRFSHIKPLTATGPDSISEKVAESIKEAEEACAGDPVSGECVAAWDTVEELSAAASHARDKNKKYDPLETYCKDNPETDECRTYDN